MHFRSTFTLLIWYQASIIHSCYLYCHLRSKREKVRCVSAPDTTSHVCVCVLLSIPGSSCQFLFIIRCLETYTCKKIWQQWNQELIRAPFISSKDIKINSRQEIPLPLYKSIVKVRNRHADRKEPILVSASHLPYMPNNFSRQGKDKIHSKKANWRLHVILQTKHYFFTVRS